MVILGIDPGTTSIGYALLKSVMGAPRLDEAGLLTIRAVETPRRLKELHDALGKIIARSNPNLVAVERLFFSKNQKTALAVAEARGVILLTTALAGIRVLEYTPLEVKKTVTGDGKADKPQVKKMLQLTLEGAREREGRDDVFDAIAIALTCFYKERYLGNLGNR